MNEKKLLNTPSCDHNKIDAAVSWKVKSDLIFVKLNFPFPHTAKQGTTREMNYSSNGFWNLPGSLKKPHLKTIKRYDLMWCGLWVILDEENSVYEFIYRGAICFSVILFYAVLIYILMGKLNHFCDR